VQVENAGELAEMSGRLQQLEADVVEEMGTACCYAKSDKYWATDPSGIAWRPITRSTAFRYSGAPKTAKLTRAAAACPNPSSPKSQAAFRSRARRLAVVEPSLLLKSRFIQTIHSIKGAVVTQPYTVLVLCTGNSCARKWPKCC